MQNMKINDKNQEWIGNIPKNWTFKKIKYVLAQRNEKNIPIKSKDILSLTAKQGVIPYTEKEGGGNKPKTDFSAYKLAYPGDIVMNSMNILSGAVGLSKYFGCVSPVYYMLYCSNDEDDIRYFYYVFANKAFQSSLLGIGNGILMKESENGTFNTIRMRIPIEKLNNMSIPYPKPEIQKAIANFLDKKIGKIDEVSKKIQQEITDLEEYRRSIITKAVTKGIDKNIPMKDSGIDWIGKIPQDFNIVRLKFMLETPLKYGANESGIDYDPNLPRYIRITDITSDSKLKEENKLSLSSTQAMGYILKNNTILFARSGATVGKTFLYKSTMGEAAFAGYLIAAKINESKINPKWIYYYTKSNAYWNWVNQAFSQATIQNIGAEKYSNLLLTVPKDKNQQSRIISKLDRMNAKIDRVIKKKQKLLNYLDKYKQSIIYEYVTGKKQVSSKESAKA